MSNGLSRRLVLKSGLLAIGTAALGKPITETSTFDTPAPPATDPWYGLKAGIASYTFRKLSLDETIKATQLLGLQYISIKDFHLSLKSSTEERKSAIGKLKAAGITAMSCGNVTMENDEAMIRQAFEYARDCGIPTIVCSPDPKSFPLLDKAVKEFNIKLAIHNHGPEDKRWPSPYDVWNAIKNYDTRIGLCIDVGHTARAKVNPAEAIIKCKSRLYDLHFKDIESTEPNGGTIQAGRGVLSLKAILSSIIKIKYQGLLSVEYERSPDNAYPEVAETIGYTKGLLKGMMAK
ncbi:MAG: sugar phosphate isomerase/epimerase [Chitinophagaceae bacterium]|nr:sugar phosphate isomerase/epimerase [Chitinophagaceae bacterium]